MRCPGCTKSLSGVEFVARLRAEAVCVRPESAPGASGSAAAARELSASIPRQKRTLTARRQNNRFHPSLHWRLRWFALAALLVFVPSLPLSAESASHAVEGYVRTVRMDGTAAQTSGANAQKPGANAQKSGANAQRPGPAQTAGATSDASAAQKGDSASKNSTSSKLSWGRRSADLSHDNANKSTGRGSNRQNHPTQAGGEKPANRRPLTPQQAQLPNAPSTTAAPEAQPEAQAVEGSTPYAFESANQNNHPGPGKESSLAAPKNVRAMLILPGPEQTLQLPRLRVQWNPSSSPHVELYRVSLWQDGQLLQEDTVPAAQWYWDSQGMELQQPGPLIQVQAETTSERSDPVRLVEYPLYISTAPLLHAPEASLGQNQTSNQPYNPTLNQMQEPAAKDVPPFNAQPTYQSQLPPGTIRALAMDPDQEHIWVGTSGGGLARFSTQRNMSQWFSSMDGLAGDDIAALLITRDRNAPVLWAATNGGLSRIDLTDPSFRIRSYEFSRNVFRGFSTRRPGINAMSEDSKGRILLGTHTDGLLIFDPAKEEGWQRNSSDGVLSDIIWSILPDPGRPFAWLGTSDGLQHYPIESSSALPDTGQAHEVASLQVPIRGMVHTANGILLLNPDVLYQYSPSGGQPLKLQTFRESDVPLQNGMVFDGENIWIITQGGLRRYHVGQTLPEFRRLELSLPSEVAANAATDPASPEVSLAEAELSASSRLSAIAMAPDKSLWLGLSDGRGLVHFKAGIGIIERVASNPAQIFRGINAIAQDGAGNIWLGTDVGPMRIEPIRHQVIPLVQVDATGVTAESLPQLPIYTLTPTKEGGMYLGHSCGNNALPSLNCLTQWSPQEGFETFLRDGTGLREFQSARVSVLHGEELYVAFQRGGLKVFFASLGRGFASHKLPQFTESLGDTQITALEVDGTGTWIGTDQGLYFFREPQPETTQQGNAPGINPQSMQPPPGMPEQLRSVPVNALLLDQTGNLWVGTDSGLWRRSRSQDREYWQQVFGGSVDKAIRTLFLDAQQRLWIGTIQGLYRSAAMTALDSSLSTEPVKLLADERIQSIFVDDEGTAWVGTDQGLMVVPPFRAAQRETPMRSWLPWMGLGLVLAVGLLIWHLKPTPRNPLVDSLEEDPPLLLRVPLDNLMNLISALNASHRLSLVLVRLGLDQARWQRIERIASLWPQGNQALATDLVEELVLHVANLLSAEILPTHAFKRRPAVETTAQPYSPVPDYPLDDSGVWLAPSRQQIASEPQAEGFDIGAPGIEEFRDRPLEARPDSSDPVHEPVAVPLARGGASRERQAEQLQQAPMPAGSAPDGSAYAKKSTRAEILSPEQCPPLLFILRLPDLPIRLVQREVPLVVIRGRLTEDNPAAGLLKLVRGLHLSNRYVMVLNLVNGHPLPPLDAPGTRFIPVNEEDLRGLLYARNVTNAFVQHILKYVKLTEVSPYSSKGEVANPEMFVGRKFELTRIISSEQANFSIVGARQIGKSSLMGALKRHYRNEGRREVYSITLTLQEDSVAFYRRISMLLKKNKVPRNSNEFAEMMELHHTKSWVPALFLIDEVDGLLARERQQGYPVLTAMRRLQQQDICWFILAGYWELVRLGNDYHSPLYNMSEVIELGPLKKDDALMLVEKPMERMNLRFENRSLAEDIVSMTAGHPHLIQFICNQLLERMTANRSPVFTAADVKAVCESDELKTYVTRNFKANAGLLDEVVVYSTIASLRFSHQQLADALQKLGVTVAPRMREESVHKLKLVGILKEIEGRFEYALPIFRDALLKEDVSYFAATRARELMEER